MNECANACLAHCCTIFLGHLGIEIMEIMEIMDKYIDDNDVHHSFYRTQVALGSGLWVPVSLTPSIQHLFESLLM